jgi:hypothetical protein
MGFHPLDPCNVFPSSALFSLHALPHFLGFSCRDKYSDPKTGSNEFMLASLQAAIPSTKTLVDMDDGQQNRVFLEGCGSIG